MNVRNSTPEERKEFVRLWLEFLKKNPDYMECCDLEGDGPYGWLYNLIGDVYSVPFEKWWPANKEKFTLQDFTLFPIYSLDYFQSFSGADDVMIVVVNLYTPKKVLKAEFGRLLTEHHPRTAPGRPRLGDRDDVQPDIMKLRNAGHDPKLKNRIKYLQKVLDAYNLRAREPELRLYEIGRRIGINQSRAEVDDAESRRILSATVSRLIRHGNEIIVNSLSGEFPVYSK